MSGELKPGVPAPRNTIFNVASLTKSVVALLALKLVSTGKWSLDEPLDKYWVDPDIKDDPRHKN
jgi:CubicO group peptidase (beta-lactamase class C family)